MNNCVFIGKDAGIDDIEGENIFEVRDNDGKLVLRVVNEELCDILRRAFKNVEIETKKALDESDIR